jgi:TRAF3-interacting protein 1
MEQFWLPTIEAYKGFIDKPAMDEKLLSRPPFLYIMQIYVETLKVTGFGEGLYTEEELKKDYYSDSTKKLFFLKKLSTLVKMLEGKFELTIENIVRGTECQQTNVFLQKLASAAKKRTNTSEYVGKILAKINGGQAEGDTPAPNQREAQRNPEARQAPINRQGTNELGGHQREVREMTNKANNLGRQEEKEEEGNKIQFGTLERGRKKDTRIENKTGGGDDAAVATIDGMKEIIQGITQNINPMGKIIQFIDDDIESMKREHDNWSRIYSTSVEQLEDKEKLIDAELQPYKDKIIAKEEQTREKKAQIESLKTKILRNNLKIEKLLSDIVGTH